MLAAEALAGEQDVSLVAMAGESVGAGDADDGGRCRHSRHRRRDRHRDRRHPAPRWNRGARDALGDDRADADGAQLTPRQGEATVVGLGDRRGGVGRPHRCGRERRRRSSPSPGDHGRRLAAARARSRRADRVHPAQTTFAVTAITADGESLELPTSGWVPQAAGDDLGATSPDAGIGASFLLAPGAPTVLTRLMPPAEMQRRSSSPNSLARRLELADGDPLELRFAGSGRELSAGRRRHHDVLPGSTGDWGAIVDLRAVMDQSCGKGRASPRRARCGSHR